MGLPKRVLPKRRASIMERRIELLHNHYFAHRRQSEPFCYGALQRVFQTLDKHATKRLEYYYAHAYDVALRAAIKHRFVQRPEYAAKLIALLQSKNPKAKAKEFWPKSSRMIAAKRLLQPKRWPHNLPANIRVYQTSSSMYRPFKSWAQWYLANYDVLRAGALTKAGVAVAKPRSPFPDALDDYDYGDLEFFKDLHAAMTARFRAYSQKGDKGLFDPLPITGSGGVTKLHENQARVARRCLPEAQLLLTLFKTAKKGEAATNMRAALERDIEQYQRWVKLAR